MSDDKRWERRQRVTKARKALRDHIIAYKGGKCEICAYDKCPSAFDLHHLNPDEKEFNISSRMTSFEAIRAELDKCVLLCCRCHREVHDGWHPQYLVWEDSDVGGPLDEELPDFLADDEYTSDLIVKNRPPKGDRTLLTHAPAIDKTRGT